MTLCYVGLGSNLGDPAAQIRSGIELISSDKNISGLRSSPLYRSAPLGPDGQADYCNAVIEFQTGLGPQDLLARLQAIENAAGRDRDGPRWGPRTLDLDLLLYGGLRIDSRPLQVPHPEIENRSFVLQPLCDLAPKLEIPGAGSVSEVLARLSADRLNPWEPQ